MIRIVLHLALFAAWATSAVFFWINHRQVQTITKYQELVVEYQGEIGEYRKLLPPGAVVIRPDAGVVCAPTPKDGEI